MNDIQTKLKAALEAPFGSILADQMAQVRYQDGRWQSIEWTQTGPIALSPAAHVFHYASTCFEGLKIHKWTDGSLNVFRLDSHLARFQNSARALCLPEPPTDLVAQMIQGLAKRCRQWAPDYPGSLYVRPTLIGTKPGIGAAAKPSSEALLYVLLAPVGDYFKGGARPLKILIENDRWRAAPGFGGIKTGGNYASALSTFLKAKQEYHADQVLFAPSGDVQETGAANFLLINGNRMLTKGLDDTFLPGITRNSILRIAKREGFEVEERAVSIDERWDWIKDGEAMLSGTAAVLAGIGTIVFNGTEFRVGNGQIGPSTQRLRQSLVDIQRGAAEDPFGWISPISS